MYKEIRIDLSTAVVDYKYCFQILLPNNYLKINSKSKIFNTLVYWDDEILSVPTDQHQEIREFGDGRYSIWYSNLYFSTPQNKSLSKFKSLIIRVFDRSIVHILQNNYCNYFGSTDNKLLDILKVNKATNNSFINNYFESFNSFVLHSHEYFSMENIRKVFIIGCGTEPITAIRFLTEGASDIYVNDILEVKKTYSEIEKNTILDLIGMFSPQKKKYSLTFFLKFPSLSLK